MTGLEVADPGPPLPSPVPSSRGSALAGAQPHAPPAVVASAPSPERQEEAIPASPKWFDNLDYCEELEEEVVPHTDEPKLTMSEESVLSEEREEEEPFVTASSAAKNCQTHQSPVKRQTEAQSGVLPDPK